MYDDELTISPALFKAIVAAESKYCREIRRCDPSTAVTGLIRGSRAGFGYLEPYLSKFESRTRLRMLELGSGYGFGLCRALKRGYNVVGIEPGNSPGFEGRYEFATTLLKDNGFEPAGNYLKQAFAEDLPFSENSFDIVCNIAVLEHVRDIERCLQEAVRVVKPDGRVIMRVPSYHAFYEGHYNIPWLPFLLRDKRLAKAYVKHVFHRDPYFVDEMNFTTPRGVCRAFRKIAPRGATIRAYPLLSPIPEDYQGPVPLPSLSRLQWLAELPLRLEQGPEAGYGMRSACSWVRKTTVALAGFPIRLLELLGLARSFTIYLTKPSEA
jgi:SAM-dependent methyltransferase